MRRFEYVEVNTRDKAEKIKETLKKANRHSIVEDFMETTGHFPFSKVIRTFYHVYYYTKED